MDEDSGRIKHGLCFRLNEDRMGVGIADGLIYLGSGNLQQ